MRSDDIEHLAAGDVAVLGLPWDWSSSCLRGASEGPQAVRSLLRAGSSNLCAESGIDLAEEARLADLGDLRLPPEEASLALIADAAARVAACGARLLGLGGDHAVTWPLLQGRRRQRDPVAILHFDAHPDLYDVYEGNRASHACPFARIMEEGLATRLVQVGVRTMNPHQREQADRFGVEVIDMPSWRAGRRPEMTGEVYVSVDLDGFDPAYAPGVSHLEPGGLTPNEVIEIIQQLPGALVGADIVELNPRRDFNGLTAALAAKLFKELAARML